MVKKQWASVYAFHNFVCIQTCSGLRMTGGDPDRGLYLLPENAPLDEVGRILAAALAQSRQLTSEEAIDFFTPEAVNGRYERWVNFLMDQSGIRVRKTLFNKMKNCAVECDGDVIVLKPRFHDKLEAWSGRGVTEADYVSVTKDDEMSSIGAAVNLALSRCTER